MTVLIFPVVYLIDRAQVGLEKPGLLTCGAGEFDFTDSPAEAILHGKDTS